MCNIHLHSTSAVLCGLTTEKQFDILEGRSLTIPCHYEPQYASYVKYWCRGKMREFCTSLTRTDDPHTSNAAVDKVSIVDDPVQLVFTVVMNDLKEDDSGWYMCGMEVGGLWSADVSAYTYISVIHGMLVNSPLIGEEGSSVKAECLYSKRFRESEKKWCRKDDLGSCVSTGSERSREDTSVSISDDRTGAFSVTLKKLQMNDTGWYWCSAGQEKKFVHLLVTSRPTTASVTSPPPPSQDDAHQSVTGELWSMHSHILGALLVCFSVMFLVGLAILARRLWIMQKQVPVLRHIKEVKARLTERPTDDGDLQNAAVVFINRECPDVHMY
ncbi:polymeric immunoglobulin receptor isoform X2 [Betta splendens]|uniref:polymeric immunoglobulin receptor isoform X2 n=1 Tax=Betta splendens TaxID=158456 RepID=UPI0010F885EF|nr:polymeric immunoglobulin receptor isoform X2 [Betta splendens]